MAQESRAARWASLLLLSLAMSACAAGVTPKTRAELTEVTTAVTASALPAATVPAAVGPIEWEPAEELTTTNSWPVTVINDAGDTLVAWTSERRIWIREATRDAGWRPVEYAPHRLGQHAPGLLGAAIDEDGALTLVGASESARRYRIHAWSRSPGGRWSSPELLASGPVQDIGLHSLSMTTGPRGTALVTWFELDDARAIAVFRSAGGPWTAPYILPNGGPSVVGTIGPDGQAYVVYPAGPMGTLVAVRRSAGRWQQPVPLPARPAEFYEFDADIARRGELVVAWKTRDGTYRAGRLTRSGWRDRRLARDVASSWRIHVEAASDGAAVFVWVVGRFEGPAGPGALHARSQSPRGRLTPRVVVTESRYRSTEPRLTSNRRGDVLVSWPGPGGPEAAYDDVPYVAFSAAGSGTWSEPVDVSGDAGSGHTRSPGTALGLRGEIVVTWDALCCDRVNLNFSATMVRRGKVIR